MNLLPRCRTGGFNQNTYICRINVLTGNHLDIPVKELIKDKKPIYEYEHN